MMKLNDLVRLFEELFDNVAGKTSVPAVAHVHMDGDTPVQAGPPVQRRAGCVLLWKDYLAQRRLVDEQLRAAWSGAHVLGSRDCPCWAQVWHLLNDELDSLENAIRAADQRILDSTRTVIDSDSELGCTTTSGEDAVRDWSY